MNKKLEIALYTAGGAAVGIGMHLGLVSHLEIDKPTERAAIDKCGQAIGEIGVSKVADLPDECQALKNRFTRETTEVTTRDGDDDIFHTSSTVYVIPSESEFVAESMKNLEDDMASQRVMQGAMWFILPGGMATAGLAASALARPRTMPDRI